MESEKLHFRHILLFYYRKGKNAVKTRKKLSNVYGEDVLTERQCQNWFAKFRSGNFDIEDARRSGRPLEANEDTIKALIEANRQITIREIAERLNLSNSTVHDHLKRNIEKKTKLCSEQPNMMDFKNTCRGCMRSDQILYPLFFDKLSDIFMTCTELKVLENDKLPQNICSTCIRHLEASHQFKLQCQTSEATFISYLTDNSNSSTKPLLMPITDVKAEPSFDVNGMESEPNYDIPIVKSEPSWNVTNVKSEPSYGTTVVKSEPSCDVTNVESEPSYDVTVVKSEPSCDLSDVDHSPSEPDSESEHENNCMDYTNFTNEIPTTLMMSNNEDSSNINSSNLSECSECKKRFSHISLLEIHASTCNKTSKRIISCGLCDFECDRENIIKLNLHLEEHMRDGILSCKNCDYTGVDFADYLCHRYEHQTTDYGKRLYCWRCGSRFYNMDRLEFHIRSKYLNKRPGLCKDCLKGFGCMRDFRAHKCEKTNVEPYKQCDVCGESCLTQRSFTRHINSHTINKNERMNLHKKSKSIVCHTCGNKFKFKSELISHQFELHDPEHPLLCKHCGKVLKNKRALHRHILRIMRKKEFKCSICGNISTSKSDLKMHMNTHFDLKPFQCEYCNECYKTRAYLAIHIRTHTGERPYECDTCGNAFPSSSSLTRHKLVHSEDRVKYPCTICSRSFLENSRLKMHMSLHETQNERSNSNLSIII